MRVYAFSNFQCSECSMVAVGGHFELEVGERLGGANRMRIMITTVNLNADDMPVTCKYK